MNRPKQLSEAWFQEFAKELIEETPEIIPFDGTKESAERMKLMSGIKQGYELCLTKLGVNYD